MDEVWYPYISEPAESMRVVNETANSTGLELVGGLTFEQLNWHETRQGSKSELMLWHSRAPHVASAVE